MRTTNRLEPVTLRWLRSRNVCKDQVRTFAHVFGTEAELTRANLFRAAECGLFVDWISEHILTCETLTEYERITAPALAEYQEAIAPALAEYQQVMGLDIMVPAWAEYERITAPATTRFALAAAQALADVLGLD